MKYMLTFILAFPYKEEIIQSSPIEDKVLNSSKRKQTKTKISVTKHSQVRKSSTKIKNISFVSRIPSTQIPDVGYFIKPLSYLAKTYQIECNLPGPVITTYKFQINYFGNCASIVYNKNAMMIKTDIVDNKSIMAFTVIFRIDTNDISSPVLINEQTLSVDIKTVFSKTVNNKLYFYFTNKNNKNFRLLYESVDSKIPDETNSIVKFDECSCVLPYVSEFHVYNLNKVKDKIIEIQTDPVVSSPVASTKSKKSKKNDSMKNESHLEIDGVQLLFEKSLWILDEISQDQTNLIYSGLFVTCTDVFNEEQRKYYKIFGVNIRHVENLPENVKTLHEIDSVTMSYALLPMIDYQLLKPVELIDSAKIKFKDYRIFFNNLVESEKLMEILQSYSLIIKIIGIRIKNEMEIPGRVWGQDLNPNDISSKFNNHLNEVQLNQELNEKFKRETERTPSMKTKKNRKSSTKLPKLNKKTVQWKTKLENRRLLTETTNEDTERVILGFAKVNLNDLLVYSHGIVTNVPVIHSISSNDPSMSFRPINLMNFHKDYKIIEKSILDDRGLKEYKTSLKLEIIINYNLNRFVLNEVLTLPSIYTRCIIIDYDINSSYHLLDVILNHNKEISDNYGFPNTCFQNLLYSGEIDRSDGNINRPSNGIELYNDESNRANDKLDDGILNKDYFTGFMIDLNKCCIVVIESLEVHFVSKIMVHRYQMETEKGRMLYNSNLIFNERLYGDFMKFNGIFVSSIGLPIDSVLNYMNSNKTVPVAALRCLETIRRILKADKIDNNLFPSTLELLSMDIEFGLPIHKYCTFQK